MTYISSLSLTSPLRSSVLQAQAALAQAQTEVSSGAPADLGLTLGAQSGTDLSLKSQIDQLNGYASSKQQRGDAAVDDVEHAQRVSDVGPEYLELAHHGSLQRGLDGSASDQRDERSSIVDCGPQHVSGRRKHLRWHQHRRDARRRLFQHANVGGQTSCRYVVSKQAFGTSQTSSAASSISGSDLQSYLDNQFGALFSDSNWQSNWSSASDTTVQSTISPTQTTSTSVSANNTAFRQIAEGYTILSEFTGSNFSASAQAAAVATATKLVNSGIAALNNAQSAVGTAQSAVSNANTQISAQVTVLQSNVSNLDSVDTYALSSRVHRAADAARSVLRTHLAVAAVKPHQLSPEHLSSTCTSCRTPKFWKTIRPPRGVSSIRRWTARSTFSRRRRPCNRHHGKVWMPSISRGRYGWRSSTELAAPENALPPGLRANLVSIGIWILKECDAIGLGKTDNYAGVADVCATIRDGLR